MKPRRRRQSTTATTTGFPTPGPAEQTVWRVDHGVLIDAPLVPTWGSQPWAAVLWPDQRAPGGWARATLPAGPAGRGYLTNGLTPGDVIEFGADYPTHTGRNTLQVVPRRWYGVILATNPTHLVALGPFPLPEPAHHWAEQAMQSWRQSLTVDLPALTEPDEPAPALLFGASTPMVPVVEVRTTGPITVIDDPTHGRLVVDAALYTAAMGTDTDTLTERLSPGDRRPALTGKEPKPTLAALAVLHAPEHFAAPAAPTGTAEVPDSSRHAVYYGHPDGTVDRVDHTGTRPMRPTGEWSPDGFAWGYQGDRSTELAHSLLVDATRSNEAARRHAQRYSSDMIAHLPQGQAWSLPVSTVAGWAAGAEQPTPAEVATGRRPPSRARDLEAGL